MRKPNLFYHLVSHSNPREGLCAARAHSCKFRFIRKLGGLQPVIDKSRPLVAEMLEGSAREVVPAVDEAEYPAGKPATPRERAGQAEAV
jgi:hypothetical protein